MTEVLRIPSTLDELQRVDSTVERIAREMGFTESACADLGICVTEAAGNAIVHAHHEQPDLHVEIRFDRYPDSLKVAVRDHGSGFNTDSIPDPTLPENLLKEHGRGLLVIQSLMDGVEIERLDDGMQIVMVKNLSR
jgi:serine/threonine-protein kinase RsbW